MSTAEFAASVRAAKQLVKITWRPAEIARAIDVAKGASPRGAVQYVPEFAPLLAMLLRLRPRTLVEIGTHLGGSFWAFCQVAPDDATLVSVDLPGGPGGAFEGEAMIPKLRSYGKPGQTLEFLLADSHAPETLEQLRELIGHREIDFLLIDGDHSKEGVRQDFENFSPLVRAGGLIAFHDIVPGPEANVGGVPGFWQDVKKANSVELVKDWQQGGCGIGVLRPT